GPRSDLEVDRRAALLEDEAVVARGQAGDLEESDLERELRSLVADERVAAALEEREGGLGRLLLAAHVGDREGVARAPVERGRIARVVLPERPRLLDARGALRLERRDPRERSELDPARGVGLEHGVPRGLVALVRELDA